MAPESAATAVSVVELIQGTLTAIHGVRNILRACCSVHSKAGTGSTAQQWRQGAQGSGTAHLAALLLILGHREVHLEGVALE
jgi:hypothetical protein